VATTTNDSLVTTVQQGVVDLDTIGTVEVAVDAESVHEDLSWTTTGGNGEGGLAVPAKSRSYAVGVARATDVGELGEAGRADVSSCKAVGRGGGVDWGTEDEDWHGKSQEAEDGLAEHCGNAWKIDVSCVNSLVGC
jgi:hypothetical protein